MLPIDNDGEADIDLYGDIPKNDAGSNKPRERSLEVPREAPSKWSPRKAMKWQSRISSGMVGEYGAKREFQPRGKHELCNVQEVESTVQRWEPTALCIDEWNSALVLDHAHFASAVNLFSYPAEQISSERVPH